MSKKKRAWNKKYRSMIEETITSLHGFPLKTIAKRLNDSGIPCQHGGVWTASHVSAYRTKVMKLQGLYKKRTKNSHATQTELNMPERNNLPHTLSPLIKVERVGVSVGLKIMMVTIVFIQLLIVMLIAYRGV